MTPMDPLSLSSPLYFLSPLNISALRLGFSPLSPYHEEEASPEITALLVTTYNVLTLLLELLITVITGA